MRKSSALHVGLDAHANSIVTVAEAGSGGEVRHVGTTGGDLASLDRMLDRPAKATRPGAANRRSRAVRVGLRQAVAIYGEGVIQGAGRRTWPCTGLMKSLGSHCDSGDGASIYRDNGCTVLSPPIGFS